MINSLNMPVSMSHAVDQFKTKVKYDVKNVATVAGTGAAAYLVAPKATPQVAKSFVNGISTFTPQAKNFLGKALEHSKNLFSQTGKAWNALPPKAKVVVGAGIAILGLLGLGRSYEMGKVDGKHQTVKELIKHTNESGLYI